MDIVVDTMLKEIKMISVDEMRDPNSKYFCVYKDRYCGLKKRLDETKAELKERHLDNAWLVKEIRRLEASVKYYEQEDIQSRLCHCERCEDARKERKQ
jgi:hypothetical protein